MTQSLHAGGGFAGACAAGDEEARIEGRFNDLTLNR
jgi:hypothetical protein